MVGFTDFIPFVGPALDVIGSIFGPDDDDIQAGITHPPGTVIPNQSSGDTGFDLGGVVDPIANLLFGSSGGSTGGTNGLLQSLLGTGGGSGLLNSPLLASLLSGAGNAQAIDALNDAEARRFGEEKRRDERDFGLFTAGVEGPEGVRGRLDPETGSLTDTDSPMVAALKQAAFQNENQANLLRRQLGRTGSDLVEDFAAGPDFTLQDFLAEMERDNARKREALVDPLVNSAAILENRNRGGTSNFGKPGGPLDQVGRNLLSTIQIGGEKGARNEFEAAQGRFQDRTLGTGSQLLNSIAGGRQIQAPQPTSGSATPNFINSLSDVRPVGADFSGSIPFNAAGTGIGVAQANQAAADQATSRNRLFDAIFRQQGNQQNTAKPSNIFGGAVPPGGP